MNAIGSIGSTPEVQQLRSKVQTLTTELSSAKSQSHREPAKHEPTRTEFERAAAPPPPPPAPTNVASVYAAGRH